MSRLTTAVTCTVAALLLLSGGCSTVRPSEVAGSAVATQILIEASFEPSWMARDAWTLRVALDGTVVGSGHNLGRYQKRLSEDSLEMITQSVARLTTSLEPASYSSMIEDADTIRLKVTRDGRVFEYRLEQPPSMNCSSKLQDLARVWDLVILSCAPKATCNGSTCLLCDDRH